MSNQENLKLNNKPLEVPIIQVENVRKNIDTLEKKYSSRFDISLKDVQNNPEIKEKKLQLEKDIKQYETDKSVLDKEQKRYQDIQSEIIKLEISKKDKEAIYNQKKTENSPESQKIANSTNLEIEKLGKNIEDKNTELSKIDIKWLEEKTEADITNIYKSLSAYQDTLLTKYQEKIWNVDDQLKNIYDSELQPQYDKITWEIQTETEKITWFENNTDEITSTNLKDENIKKESKKIDKNYESIKESQKKKLELYTQWVSIKFYKYRIESAKVNLYKDIYADLSNQFKNIDSRILWVQKSYYEWQKSYFWAKEIEFKTSTLYKLAWDSKAKVTEYTKKSTEADNNPEAKKIKDNIENTKNISSYMDSLNKYINTTTDQNIHKSIFDYLESEQNNEQKISETYLNKSKESKWHYEEKLTDYRVYEQQAKDEAEKWNYDKAKEFQDQFKEEQRKLWEFSSKEKYFMDKNLITLQWISEISTERLKIEKPLQNYQKRAQENFEITKKNYEKIKDPSKIEKQSPDNSKDLFETQAQKDIKETLPKNKEEEKK